MTRRSLSRTRMGSRTVSTIACASAQASATAVNCFRKLVSDTKLPFGGEIYRSGMSRTKHFKSGPVRPGCRRWLADTMAEQITTAPDGFDAFVATGGCCKLFSELANEDIDYFGLGFVYPVVEMVHKRFLGHKRPQALARA